MACRLLDDGRRNYLRYICIYRHTVPFFLRYCSTTGKTTHAFVSLTRPPGAWDMFHAGHVAILRKAREFGDYLIAGVHSDEVVNAQRGYNMPIMNLNERVLSVLGCAHVDDVLIDAPLQITRWAIGPTIKEGAYAIVC